DLEVSRRLDLFGGYGAFARGFQEHLPGPVYQAADPDVLDIEEELDHVLTHVRQRRELMVDALDTNSAYRRSRQSAQKRPAEGVAYCCTEPCFQGLGHDAAKRLIRLLGHFELRDA